MSLEPLKGKVANPRSLFQATGKDDPHFRTWTDHKEGNPVGCMAEVCRFSHDNTKIPTDFVNWLCTEGKPRTDKILAKPAGWRAENLGPPTEEGASSRNYPHT